MAPAIVTLTIGGILIYSAVAGVGILDILKGVAGTPVNPAGYKPGSSVGNVVGEADDDFSQEGSADIKGGWNPKDVIDRLVVPRAAKHKMVTGRTPAMVSASNAVHGPTVSGTRSDHQGPPSQAWAADMSNGTSPTPEMDALARDLAKAFGIPWSGSGAVSKTANGFRYQMIYRSSIGGNHYNHVHFGVRRA